jgi:hypothetical protein
MIHVRELKFPLILVIVVQLPKFMHFLSASPRYKY